MPTRSRQSARMKHFSTLAGPFSQWPKKKPATVPYQKLISKEPFFYRVWIRLLAWMCFSLVVLFAGILFWPSHWVAVQEPQSPVHIQNIVMLGLLMALQLMVIIGAFSAVRSTLKARDPIPTRPQKGLRVAFITTRAPGEPVSIVKKTLTAAKKITYTQGFVDVWLLDETDDPELRKLCAKLKVNHFSRKGVEKWNTPPPTGRLMRLVRRFLSLPSGPQPDPVFAAKTKHGNLNSWGDYVSSEGYHYDIIAGVDTDQVPEPNFLMRMLGYFKDPDVAFVVGPQVYGNYRPGLHGTVSRWAESQASFFQSTIQRAANASSCPMFVGTNYAVRSSVLAQIGGVQPCITEDMATGIAVHSRKNPQTGKHWKSVYTPDVLAVGEGPDIWGPYFTQQWRWAAGAFDTWRKTFWLIIFHAHRRTILHYLLIMTFYPIAAFTWILAVLSSMIYLAWGATAVIAPWGMFVSLYLMATVTQLSLYFWNRRYNVSPHEPAGSYGIGGIIASTLMAPVYFSALMGIISGKKPNFVVTKKGAAEQTDNLSSFKLHLQWAFILLSGLAYGIYAGHTHPAMLIWLGMLVLVCIFPALLAFMVAMKVRLAKPSAKNQAAQVELNKENAYAQ